jgi:hypothetical protein
MGAHSIWQLLLLCMWLVLSPTWHRHHLASDCGVSPLVSTNSDWVVLGRSLKPVT